MSESWLTKKEVAATLRVHPRTVERLHLPCMRVGGQNRYYMSQVYAALAGNEGTGDVVPLRPRRKVKAA